MPRVAAILGFSVVAALILCAVYPPAVSAQVPETEARKFDEFGRIHHCDLTARLDNFTIQIENTRGATAHLVSYAPPGMGERLLELIKEYLVNTRGLKAERIKTTYAGRNSDLTQPRIELWVVPRNALPPRPEKYESQTETFKGLLHDQQVIDDFGVFDGDGMGPGIGETADASFADILRHQKNAIGYVVVYSGEDATPGAWQNIAQDRVEYLKMFDVEASRIKVIFGGHQKESKLQLWIFPKDEPPPVRDAGPELPLARTIKAGDFYASALSDKRNQSKLFTRLTEVLRAQKTVRAFLVVRLEPPDQDAPTEPVPPLPAGVEEAPATEPVEEIEEVDLTKLVEKWRLELANTHKIGPDRFIVVFTPTRETESNQLSLWIVPKGQPLPDPNEEEEEETPENSEESKSPKKPE